MNKHRLRMGGMAAAVTAMVIVGVILLNLLAGMLTDRFFLKYDLTGTKLFEISQESVDILRDLPGQATIYLLLSEIEAMNNMSQAMGLNFVELLQKYSTLSGGRIKIQFMDPTLNPDIQERFGVGTVQKADLLVEGPSRVKHIAYTELFDFTDAGQLLGYRIEQALTSAVLFVMAEHIPGVVFTEGHGEAPSDTMTGGSVTMLREMFERSGFSASTLSLAASELPDDTKTIVIACPETDFIEEEIARLDDFVRSGGNVLYLTGNERNKNLTGWLEERGIRLEDYIILDDVQNLMDPRFVVPLINAHDMFNSVPNSSLPYLQIPRAMRLVYQERGSVTVTGVLGTSPDSYGRLIGSDNTELERGEDDALGPFIVGAVSSYRTYDNSTGGASDSYVAVLPYSLSFDGALSMYAYLNNDLSGAAVRYLTPPETTSGLVIPTKALSNPVLKLTGFPSLLLSIFLVAVLPLGIFLTGLVLWLRRRKL